MKRFSILLSAAALTLVSALAVAGNQQGNHTYNEMSGNAISICKGALPAYETMLRQRPLALANEGTEDTYVNCGFRSPTNSQGTEWFSVELRNLGNQEVTVSCTGVMGTEGNNAVYSTRSVNLPAGAYRSMKWTWGQDYQGEKIQTNTGFQCKLPPQVALTKLNQAYWSAR